MVKPYLSINTPGFGYADRKMPQIDLSDPKLFAQPEEFGTTNAQKALIYYQASLLRK
jgi:hypothetical protein